MMTAELLQEHAFKRDRLGNGNAVDVVTCRAAWPFDCKIVVVELRLRPQCAAATRPHFAEHYLLRANEELLRTVFFAGGSWNAFTTDHAIQCFFVLPAGFDFDAKAFLSRRCTEERWRQERRILRAELERYQGIKNSSVLGSMRELQAVRCADIEQMLRCGIRDCLVLEADSELWQPTYLRLADIVGAMRRDDPIVQQLGSRWYGGHWSMADIALAMGQPIQCAQVVMEYMRYESA